MLSVAGLISSSKRLFVLQVVKEIKSKETIHCFLLVPCNFIPLIDWCVNVIFNLYFHI